jgi:hypothetical protein
VEFAPLPLSASKKSSRQFENRVPLGGDRRDKKITRNIVERISI